MFLLQFLAFESPTLDLDITLIIQFGIFILLLLALRKFVLIPYLRAYDQREALTKGAQEEAQALQEAAAKAQAEYDSERQKVYSVAERERRDVVAKANADAAGVIEKARRDVQDDIAQKQAALDEQLATARRNAASEIDALSVQIASKILV